MGEGMGEGMTESFDTPAQATIRRLPAEVIGRIAAGEMITRPSAAVKELIENALDAGAQRITVSVTESLDRRLEIADDGCGIPAADLTLALERYTTSKLRREEDLLAVETLGFRGEALAAIVEIARVTLVSCAERAEHAWSVRAEAGRIETPQAAARARGTTVIVEDIFFNTPVRKRFLKPGPGELRLARDAIQAYALVHPAVAWRLEQDGREVLDYPTAPDLRTRLLRIHGPRLVEGLLAIDAAEGPLTLRGFVGVPELARPGSHHQVLFVNGRWIASPWLAQAVRQAFGDLIPSHQSPWAVLFLTVAPDAVDVNLHPTKREVRFLDERAVFGFVQRSVRPAVARLLPRLYLDRGDAGGGATDTAPDSPASARRPANASGVAGDWRAGGDAATPTRLDGFEEARRLYGAYGSPDGAGAVADAVAGDEALSAETAPRPVALWQLHNRYVLAQTRKGFFIIDQHAAHERILYERVLDRMQHEPGGAQQLLFPVILELSDEEMELFRVIATDLTRMGFDCEAFEERSVVVRGVPPLWRARGEGSLVRDLLDEARETGLRPGETAEGLARAFACRAAIKAAEPLTMEEMNRLVDELFATRLPHGDPHGRPTFVFIALADLDRRFGRSG
jgi:DNA mismatch repair protein MutL